MENKLTQGIAKTSILIFSTFVANHVAFAAASHPSNSISHSTSTNATEVTVRPPYSHDASFSEEKPAKKLMIKKGDSPGGVVFETPGGDYSLTIAGYFQADATEFTGDTQGLNNGANIPSARLILNGNVTDDWGYELSYDFAGTSLENAYISYDGFNNIALVFGQFSPAWGLSNAPDTTENLTFLTQPLPIAAFSPDNGIGVLVAGHSGDFALTADTFYPRLGTTVTGMAPLAASGTLSFSPVHTETKVWHFGVSDFYQGTDHNNVVTLTTPPETDATNITNLVSTGAINNVDYTNAINGAIATVQGPFSAQAEYAHMWVAVHGTGTNSFCGYYVTASYFLTGESRLYEFENQGFYGITHIQNQRFGAWQVAARFSHITLNDGAVQGGKENNYTGGLNWYPNQHIRWMLDYTRAVADPNASMVTQRANIFSLRAQLAL